MSYTKHGSDLEHCARCGRLLAPAEDVHCAPCTQHIHETWDDDCEPWSERFPTPWIPRTLDWPAVVLLASFVAVLIGTAGMEAQAHPRTAQRTLNGHAYTWTLPDAGCQLLRAWEDGNATAFCPDGLYAFDPDGSKDRDPQTWYALSTTR